jgi:dienelactone hydrolase
MPTNRFTHPITRRHVLLSSVALLPLCGRRGFGQTNSPAAERDVAWLDEVQRPPEASDAASAFELPPLSADGRPFADLATWQTRRAELSDWWSRFLGFTPRPHAAPDFRVLESERVGGVMRERIAYDSAPGWPSEAYLLRPHPVPSATPAVVVFHSTVEHSIRQPAGVEGRREKAFGLELARRGYVTLCPRNFLWPENRRMMANEQTARFLESHPGVKGMAKMLADAMAAVDLIASLPYTDPQRIGAVGHSLGAKEVLYLAAFDPRVRVTVSSEGGIGTTFSNWDAPWYLGPAIQAAARDHEHHELLALTAPRPFLLIGGESADGDRSWPFVEAALPIYRLSTPRPRLGLLNHRQGHAVPPIAEERILEWFATYL